MFSRKMQIFLSLLLIIVILTGAASWYVLKVKPLQKQMATLENSIKSEHALIGKYEQGDVKKSGGIKDTLGLQKQIPVLESEDQFIVMLEQAEVASGSLIRNISLSKSTDTAKDQSTQSTETPNNATATLNNASGLTASQTSQTSSSQTNNKQTEPGTPAGVEKLTANLTVEADNYFEIADFVKKIESFKRITNVDKLQFSGTPEVTAAGDVPNKTGVLSYTLTVSTYYFPKLSVLKNQAPKYDPSLPAEKKNPFYKSEIPNNGVNTPSSNAEKYKVVKQKRVTYHVYSYVVKSGDTLLYLSEKYYHSQKGEDMIKSWNGIDQLEKGTTIEIPVPAESKQ